MVQSYQCTNEGFGPTARFLSPDPNSKLAICEIRIKGELNCLIIKPKAKQLVVNQEKLVPYDPTVYTLLFMHLHFLLTFSSIFSLTPCADPSSKLIPEPVFVNPLRSPGIDSQPGGVDSSESIPGLFKRLQIRGQFLTVSRCIAGC
jgi:hypothetical protein